MQKKQIPRGIAAEVRKFAPKTVFGNVRTLSVTDMDAAAVALFGKTYGDILKVMKERPVGKVKLADGTEVDYAVSKGLHWTKSAQGNSYAKEVLGDEHFTLNFDDGSKEERDGNIYVSYFPPKDSSGNVIDPLEPGAGLLPLQTEDVILVLGVCKTELPGTYVKDGVTKEAKSKKRTFNIADGGWTIFELPKE